MGLQLLVFLRATVADSAEEKKRGLCGGGPPRRMAMVLGYSILLLTLFGCAAGDGRTLGGGECGWRPKVGDTVLRVRFRGSRPVGVHQGGVLYNRDVLRNGPIEQIVADRFALFAMQFEVVEVVANPYGLTFSTNGIDVAVHSPATVLGECYECAVLGKPEARVGNVLLVALSSTKCEGEISGIEFRNLTIVKIERE